MYEIINKKVIKIGRIYEKIGIITLILIIILLILLVFYLLFIKEKTIIITFDTGGGNNISEISLKEHEQIKLPTNPKKEGYVFKGWTDENGNTITKDTIVTKNMTLKAVFVSLTLVQVVIV